MNYRYVAQRCLKLFQEIVRGYYGAQTDQSDIHGTTNPSSNLKSRNGLKPGRGRDTKKPVPPIPTPPPP